MAKLDDVIKNIQKAYGKEIIGRLEETERKYSRIPFRTPALAFIFRGGLPRTIIEALGENNSGKSSFSYSVCGEAQKLFKQEWEDEINELSSLDKPTREQKDRLDYLQERGPKRVVYADLEFSSDPEWMMKNGVDMDDLIYIRPDGQTAEQILQMLLDLIASDGVGLAVDDSLPAMVSQQAAKKTLEEKTYCGISGVLTDFCARAMPLLKKHECTFIGINNLRADLGGFNRITSPGGKFWRNACSIRLLLKKGEYYDSKYSTLKAHPESAAGNFVEVEVIKNKATKPDRRMCKFSITYDKGIDGYNDTINLSLALGIIKQAGAWYSIVDEDGEIITHDSELLKFQGMLRLREFLDNNEDVYNMVYDRVMKEICKD